MPPARRGAPAARTFPARRTEPTPMPADRLRCLEGLMLAGRTGCLPAELDAAYRWTPGTAKRLLASLAKSGDAIRCSTRQRKTPGGRWAAVWVARTVAGRLSSC